MTLLIIFDAGPATGGVEGAFREWYSREPTLTALLPVSCVCTGPIRDQDAELPYVTIMVREIPFEHRSSDGPAERAILEVDWFDRSWQDGKDFVLTLKAALHNQEMNAGSIRSRLVRLESSRYEQGMNGVWQHSQEYLIQFERLS